MGYGTDGLTFRTLRDANKERRKYFKHKKWSPAQWLQAVMGELGEYANLRKKVERGDFSMDEVRDKLADELADVVIYLDILATELGIDLGAAVMSKWNRVSDRIGAPLVIDAYDWYRTD